MSALDVKDWQGWLQDELCSLPIDTRLDLLVRVIQHNQYSFDVEETEVLNSVFDMIKAIDCAMLMLSRSSRFHVSNFLRDAADRADHLPPKDNEKAALDVDDQES